MIKTFEPRHKCYRINKIFHCNSKYFAILSRPGINIRVLFDLVKNELHIYVSKIVYRRAKNKVLTAAMGDPRVEFAKLYNYVDEIKRSNLGSTCFVKCER